MKAGTPRQTACERLRQVRAPSGRTDIVVDRGNPKASVMTIGEGPGENEDKEGRAFVGRRKISSLSDQAASSPNQRHEDEPSENLARKQASRRRWISFEEFSSSTRFYVPAGGQLA